MSKSESRQQKKEMKADNKANEQLAKLVKPITGIIPIRDTYKGAFKYSDGSYMDIIQVRTKDLESVSDIEVNTDAYMFTKFNRTYSDDYKIISVNFPANTKTQQAYFRNKINHCTNSKLQAILEEKLDQLVYAEQTSTNREHYLMIFGSSFEQLNDNRGTIFSALGNLVESIDIDKKVQLLYMLANKSTCIFFDEEAAKYVQRADKDELVEKYGYNPHLLNAIQPIGNVTFGHEDYVRCGSGYECCVYVYGYPKNVDRHWLNGLTNNAGTISIIDVESTNTSAVKKNLANSIAEYASRSATQGNIVDRMDYQAQQEQLKTLAYKVQQLGEVIKRITTRIYVSAKTEEELHTFAKRLIEHLEDNGYKAAINLNEQDYEFKSMYLSASQQKKSYNARTGKAMQSTTLAGGDPFHFSFLNDKYGSILGHTITSGIDGRVIFDLFHNDKKRTYYNSVVVGEMGMGKSTLLKTIARDRVARGDFLRIIDVTGEFSLLCTSLGGTVIALDGSQGILNALQINKGADTEEESFSMHLSKLSTMYKFIQPECSHTEKLLFEQVTRKLYESRHLTPDTIESGRILTELPATEYPIMEDLIPVVDDLLEAENNQETINMLRHIKLVIEDLCYNYGHIFNGHTSIDNLINAQFVVYNIRALSLMKQEIFDAQLFNALSLCWANAIKVGTQMKHLYEAKQIELQDVRHFLLILDESHKSINSSKPFAVEQVTTYEREGRKYFAGLMFASQSIRDYIPEGTSNENIAKIKTLFELCSYKFIMHQDSNSINLLRNVFQNQFTDTELNNITKLEKGQAILNIKSVKNLRMQIDVTDEELALFKGGL